MKRSMTIALVLWLVLALISSAWALDINEVQEELDRAQQEMENLQKQAQQTDSQIKATSSQLSELNQQIYQAERELQALEQQILTLNENIENKEQEIASVQIDLDNKTELLTKRVQAVYKYSSLSYLSVLFKAENLADFLSRFTLMKKVISNDRQLIADVKQQSEQLTNEKAALEDQRKMLVMSRQTVDYQRTLYETRSAQRESLLRELEKDAQEYEKALLELEKESKELEEKLKELQAGEVIGSGKFTWPTPGYIWVTSAFGYRTHPITQKKSFHSGIDIGVPYGNPIYAADSGTVVYAGNYGAYGKVVIINHGNGKSTLYAHNSQLLVEENQGVAQGQIISKCGTTGLSTGPHLHFEIRINGEPVNPLDYVTKK